MLLIKNIGLLQTSVGTGCARGIAQRENLKLRNAAILIERGKISEITSDGVLPACPRGIAELDAKGLLVTPGLVDSHTHLVFGGWRQHEVQLKLKGASYLEILRAGGGILDTVRKTRAATEEELYNKSLRFLDEMLALGVTSVEAKSGYGLDLETELKQLRVLKALNQYHKVDIVSTFMGAHAVADEYAGNGNAYIDFVCETVLPAVCEQGLASCCDVFCEDSVFNVEQSRKVLNCAKEHGLKLKIHADEIHAIGGAELAGEVGAISAEHLIATEEAGMAALAKAGTVAVLLPQTSFYLAKQYAKAKRMIELGIPVALASDFNPGSCPSLNLQFAVNLGYLGYGLQPEEILTAVTRNAAYAIGLDKSVGTLEKGKQADIVIWDAPDFEMLCYRFGSNQVHSVIKKGEIVV